MTRIKVSKEIKIGSDTVEFSLDTSLGGSMDLEIRRLAQDQRDDEDSISLLVDTDSIDEIIATLRELQEKVN